MDIKIEATHGVCNQFIDESGEKGEVTIVISPLRIETNKDESRAKIDEGCNLWKSCKNDGCYFSLVARAKHRQQKQ